MLDTLLGCGNMLLLIIPLVSSTLSKGRPASNRSEVLRIRAEPLILILDDRMRVKWFTFDAWEFSKDVTYS
jgi:hypothetical protein